MGGAGIGAAADAAVAQAHRERQTGAQRPEVGARLELEGHLASLAPKERAELDPHCVSVLRGDCAVGVHEAHPGRQGDLGHQRFRHRAARLVELASQEGIELGPVLQERVVAVPRVGDRGHEVGVVVEAHPQGRGHHARVGRGGDAAGDLGEGEPRAIAAIGDQDDPLRGPGRCFMKCFDTQREARGDVGAPLGLHPPHPVRQRSPEHARRRQGLEDLGGVVVHDHREAVVVGHRSEERHDALARLHHLLAAHRARVVEDHGQRHRHVGAFSDAREAQLGEELARLACAYGAGREAEAPIHAHPVEVDMRERAEAGRWGESG